MQIKTAATLCALTIVLCACTGYRGGTSLPSVPASTDSRSVSANDGDARENARLTLRLAIPRAKRRARYISASTQSIRIKEGSTTLGTFNTTPATKGCALQSGLTVCTYHMGAVPGKAKVFSILTYDAQGGGGSVLAQTFVKQTIAANKANTISATLEGVPASLSLGLSDTSPTEGTQASITLTVTAFDAGGNTIVGPGIYAHPIALTDSDKSGATGLSASSVISPASNTVTVAYNGSVITGATFTGSAAGVTNATVTLTPVKPHSNLIGGVWAALPGFGSLAYYNNSTSPTPTLSSSTSSFGTASVVAVDNVGRAIGAYGGNIGIWPINASGNTPVAQSIATGATAISALAWDPINGRVIFAPTGQSEFGVVPSGSSGSGITYYSAAQHYPIAATIAGIAVDQNTGNLYIANATPYGYDAANANCDLLPNNEDCTSILVFTLQADGSYAFSHTLALVYYCSSGSTIVDIGGATYDSTANVLWISEADAGYPNVYGYNSTDTGCPEADYSFRGDGINLVTPGSIAWDGGAGIWVADQNTTWLQHWIDVYSGPTLPDANSYFLGPNNGNVSPTSIAVYSPFVAAAGRARMSKR